jgi:pimeloyl-ACP methyl ester carboxylesterase
MRIRGRRAGRGLAGVLAMGTAAAMVVARPSAQKKSAAPLTLVPYLVETADGARRIPAEFGRLTVPENRRKANSRSIELSFIRFKSVAARPGPPLVFLSGGPGNSGTRQAGSPSLLAWRTRMQELGDVIMLDQRGVVGLSPPNLSCPDRWNLPLDRPGSRDEMLRVARERSRACAAFWTGRGVDLAGYTTVESADDVDALREALGADRINLWGSSYGSHLAFATIRRHGDGIHRALIASVEGPDHTIKLPSNTQRMLETIGQRAKDDSELSALVPDFLGLVGQVLQRLEREPANVMVAGDTPASKTPIVVGKFDLQLATADTIGDLDAIASLPAHYYEMSRGDFTWLASTARDRRTRFISNAMSFMMDCASGVSSARVERVRREAPQTLLGDVIDFPWPDVCDAWGSPDLGNEFRSPVKSNVPVLFISGTLDGRTPVSNTEEYMAGFPNRQHLIVDGLSHTGFPLYNTPAILDAMVRHLKGETIATTRTSIPFKFKLPAGERGKS